MSRPSTGVAKGWYGLAVLALATLFGLIDRQILVLVTEPLKADLGLSDAQIGVVQGLGPALLGGLMAPPLGWLADRFDRTLVLALCVVAWSILTALCGVADGFWGLLAACAGVAVAEAGLAPLVYSFIPDLLKGERRIAGNFIYFGVVTIGGGVAIMSGGAIIGLIDQIKHALPAALAALPSWRLAFFAVAAPAPLVLLAVLSIGRVARGSRDIDPRTEPSGSLFSYFDAHKVALGGVIGASGLKGLGITAVGAWGAVAAIRVFGATPAEAGVGFGTASAVGSVAGIGLGVLLLRLLRGLGLAAPLRGLQIASAAALVPVLMIPFATEAWHLYLLLGSQITLAMMGVSLTPTMHQDIAPPLLRARFIGVVHLVFSAVAALGPVTVGVLSDAIGGSRALLIAIALTAAPAFALAALIFRGIEPAFLRTATVARAQG